MRRLLLFIILLFGYFFGFGQKFIQEYDASGVPISQQSLSKIENAIDSAIAPMSFDERSRFRVYDIGFYAYDTNKVELPYQMFNTWVDIIDGYPESDYYVIFGRVNSELNVPEEILINVRLPNSVVGCYSPDDKFALDDIIYNEANSIMSYDYSYNVIAAINKLAEKIEYGIKCACYDNGQNQNPNPDSTLCKSKYEGFDFLDDKLIGLGFRRKQIEIGDVTNWTNGSQDIYDYFGKEVIINGLRYSIPDQIKDSKAIFDTKTQVLPDTTINVDINGKVFILDDSSFVNNEWNDAFAASQNLDYCEYWVVLTAPGGKHYLYSRYTIGGQMIPAAMMRDENEITDRAGVTLSPMGAVLKVLGNAAIDALFQCAISILIDENVHTLPEAVNSVCWSCAAVEGLSSLIPWKQAESWKINMGVTVFKTVVSSLTVVIDKAVKDKNYTGEQGLNDFLVGFGASVFTQFVNVHPKLKIFNKVLISKGIGKIFNAVNNKALRNVCAKTTFTLSNGIVREIKFIPSSALKIVGKSGKTTTVLGRWDPDMKIIIKEILPHEFNSGSVYSFTNRATSGFNFLSVTGNFSDFFNQVNKPWLQAAIDAGDEIVLATTVKIKKHLYENGKLTTFGKEIKFLIEKNYRPLNIPQNEWNLMKKWKITENY